MRDDRTIQGENDDASAPAVDGFTGLAEIGRGGFSIVYRARQEHFDRDVAIKVLQVESTDHRRFVRECRALGPLSGMPGVVSVFEATSTTEGRPCIVMPYMSGGSVAEQLRRGRRFDVDDVVRSGIELAGALSTAHALGIHHRDVKPENVLIGPAGNVALSDFGIASIQSITNASQTIASLSPPYAPPERFASPDGDADPVASDVYSLGATLYAMLAGVPPFGTVQEGGISGLLRRVTDEAVPPIGRPDVPAALEAALATAMSKDPAARFESPAEFADALRRSVLPTAVSAPDVATDPLRTAPVPARGAPTVAAASDDVRPNTVAETVVRPAPKAAPAERTDRMPADKSVPPRKPQPKWLLVLAVFVAVAALAWLLSLLGGNALIDASTATTLPQSPCPTVKLPKAEERAVPQPPADVVDPQGQYTATMETSCGTMTFELLAAEATVDVNNFVYLARQGFYDNTIFHRAIRDFVIQGGDPTAPGSSSPGTGDPGYRYTGSVPATPGYQLGDLAMANSDDPSSNGSQFFIVTGPQGQNLPPNYSLFGRITEGLDVAQKISTVPVETSPADVPVIPVVVNKVTISSVETGST